MKVTRRFEFDAAHRLMGYDGPCANIHGHHYVAEITVAGLASGVEVLNKLEMLIDFKELQKIGDWIDEHWDHALLLHPKDNLVIPTKITKMPSGNPTAENMARQLYMVTCEVVLGSTAGVVVSNIRLYETPDCFVDYDG